MNQYLLKKNDHQNNLDNRFYQEKITTLIRDRFGIAVHANQLNNLKRILADAFEKFEISPEDYLQILANSPESTPLIDDLMGKITIAETYFFRDKNQIEMLYKMILPDMISKKKNGNDLSLRIWSAGCSSGEEIYTIVMMLTELMPDINKWKLHLLATDVNTEALQKGLKGVYYEWSMRSISDYYKNRYFTKKNNEYTLVEEIRNKVEFNYLNLNDDTYPSMFNGTNAQDLIVCRNVLIYFDENNVKRLMKRMCASLVEDGYLLLGASDPMIISSKDFTFVKNALYIHKSFHQRPLREKPKNEPIKHHPFNYQSILPVKIETQSPEITKSRIQSLVDEGRWQEALTLIEIYEKCKIDTFILNTKATVLANLGNLEDAIKLCERSVSIDPINIKTHFIMAMSLVELNQMRHAENELRKVIFLDKNFVEAHFQLGLLLLRIKKRDLGIKCLQNALAIAKSSDQSHLVAGFHELNYGKLAEILQKEIELHKALKG